MASKARVVSLVVVPLAVLAVVAWRFGGNESPVSPKNKEVAEQGPIGGDLDHLFPISIDGKAGYINGRGEVVIKTEFWSAWEFYGDRAVIWRYEEPSSWQFAAIDRAGKVVTPFYPNEPQYEHTYSEGLISFGGDGGDGFMDLYGNVVVLPKFYFPSIEEMDADCACAFEGGPVDGFHDGFALVHEGKRHYFIDRTGKRAFGFDVEEASAFNAGFAAVSVKGKWGMIDRTGKFTIKPRYDHVGTFSDGLVPVSEGNQKYFYADQFGNRVLDNGYTFAHSFSEGLAAVSLGYGAYTYIDTTGKAVFTLPDGATPGDFSEGLARVNLSTDVTERTAPNLTSSYSISQTMFCDRAGRIVIKLDPSDHGTGRYGQYADDFHHGLAKVWSQDDGSKNGYIDKRGNWVWFTYDWN